MKTLAFARTFLSAFIATVTHRLKSAAGLILITTFALALSVHAEDGLNRMKISPDGRGNRVRNASPVVPKPLGVVTGNGINYHGGRVLHTVNVYYIWYGDWSQDTAANSILTTYARNVGGSPYFNIETTYSDTTGSVPNAVTYAGAYLDPGSVGTVLYDSTVWWIVSNAIANGFGGTPDTNGVYFVLTAPGVTETSGFLTSYCGFHESGSYNNTNIQYAFIGDAAGGGLASCAVQLSSSPNNDPPADAMVSILAHELDEAANDPRFDAWFDSNNEESADKCVWTFGATYLAPNRSAANMSLGGLNYLIQQNWVNAGGGYCALSYAALSNFTVSATPVSQTIAPGGSTVYVVGVEAQNGYTGNVVLSVTGAQPGVTTAFATNPVIGGSGSSTLNVFASAGMAAGSSSLTIQATDGKLTRTIPITLNVADFAVSALPATRSVNQASSTTYSVSIGAAGGFSSSVGLALAGLPAGATASFSPALVTGSGSSTLTVGAGAAAAGTYLLSVSGTAASGQTHSVSLSLTIVAGDFTISVTPSSQSASGAANLRFTVAVASLGGFSSGVALSLSGLPSGASASFSPPSVNGAGSSTLTLNTGTAAAGTWAMSIAATSGSRIHTANLSLVIVQPDFTVTLSSVNPSTKQGMSVNDTVIIGAGNAFTGTVALSIGTALPPGLTAAFSPLKAGSSTLTLTPNGTPAGSYPLTVTGTSGALAHTASLSLTVTPGGSVTLTANTSTVSLSRSKTPGGSVAITLTSSGGFGGNVTLSATGLPPGATASFTPSVVGLTPGVPATSTLKLTVSSGTPAGNYSITVAGSPGGPSEQVRLTLQIAN